MQRQWAAVLAALLLFAAFATTAFAVDFTPDTLTNGTVGEFYDVQFVGSAGTPAYTFSLSSGSLPIGVSLNSNGRLSGTPKNAGTFGIGIKVTDAGAATATKVVTLVVDPPTLTVTPPALPAGWAYSQYSVSLSTTGGVAPHTYSLVSGSLPPGVGLSSAGLLSGTPDTEGTYNFTVRSTDSADGTGFHVDVPYTIIVGPPRITIAPAPGALPRITASNPNTVTFTASGGTAPYTFSLSGGSLPVGMGLNSSGTFSGTPSVTGVTVMTLVATDSAGDKSGPVTYTVNVEAPAIAVTPDALPGAVRGQPYSVTMAASGGATPYTFSLVSGALPVGMALHSTGLFDGTPTTTGSYSFTVRASDANSMHEDKTYTLAVSVIAVGPASLPPAAKETPYSQTVTASGGLAPYTFSVSSGSLPPGLSLSADGTIDGTSASPGSYPFTIRATDSQGDFGERAYVFGVSDDEPQVRARLTELAQGFVETRMSLIAAGLETPGLSTRYGAGGGPGTVIASADGGSQVLGFATSLAELSKAGGAAQALANGAARSDPFNVWIDTRLTLHARSADEEHWGRFALASVGADYLVTDSFLAGIALYGDWMEDFTSTSTVRGSGFLAGPYFSIGLAQGVTLDADLFYGRSWNDVSADLLGSTYAGNFETERVVVKAKLEGTWQADLLAIRPNATFFLMNERAGDYVASKPGGSPISIPGFSRTDVRAGVGATFEYAYVLDNGMELTPQFGFSVGGEGRGDSLFNQAYGQLTGGFVLADEAWRLGGKVAVDADTGGLRAVSAKGTFGLTF